MTFIAGFEIVTSLVLGLFSLYFWWVTMGTPEMVLWLAACYVFFGRVANAGRRA